MTGLTDQQQGYITLVAEILQAISLISIPSTLQGSLPAWIPATLFLSGAASKALMQFKGATPQQQQTILDSLHALAQAYKSMPPDQQQKFLSNLPTVLSLLETLGPLAIQQPPS